MNLTAGGKSARFPTPLEGAYIANVGWRRRRGGVKGDRDVWREDARGRDGGTWFPAAAVALDRWWLGVDPLARRATHRRPVWNGGLRRWRRDADDHKRQERLRAWCHRHADRFWLAASRVSSHRRQRQLR